MLELVATGKSETMQHTFHI